MDDAQVLGLLTRINTWWQNDPVPAAILKADHRRRDFFILRQKLHSDNRIITLRGPRQVGKTTLVGQLIDSLVGDSPSRPGGLPPNQVLYLNIENSQVLSDPEDIIQQSLEVYQTHVLEQSFRRVEGTVYVFIDEIQKVPDWASTLKYYTDTFSNLKFFVTGSVSTLIERDANETLVGRLNEVLVMPMKFIEHVRHHGPISDEDIYEYSTDLRAALKAAVKGNDPTELTPKLARVYGELYQYRPDLISLKDEYLLKGGYPGVFETDDLVEAYSILDSNLRSTVTGDIPTVFPVKKPQKLLKILSLVGHSSGSKISIRNMAKHTGLDRETVNSYLRYLEEFFLVSRCGMYSSSPYQSGGRPKAYVQDVGLLNVINSTLTESTLQNPETLGRILETVCYDHGRRLQFYLSDTQDATVSYWDKSGEVDCVLSGADYALPIEVKYGDSTEKDLRGLHRFIEDGPAEFGIAVNDAGQLIETDGIVHIPAWLFLFLC